LQASAARTVSASVLVGMCGSQAAWWTFDRRSIVRMSAARWPSPFASPPTARPAKRGMERRCCLARLTGLLKRGYEGRAGYVLASGAFSGQMRIYSCFTTCTLVVRQTMVFMDVAAQGQGHSLYAAVRHATAAAARARVACQACQAQQRVDQRRCLAVGVARARQPQVLGGRGAVKVEGAGLQRSRILPDARAESGRYGKERGGTLLSSCPPGPLSLLCTTSPAS
jgi:hypothetical protein